MRSRNPGLAVLAVGCAALAGCGPSILPEGEAILPYLEAVQAEEFDALFCLSAGAASAEELGEDEDQRRTAFEDWARAEIDAYLEGRDVGRVELAGSAVKLVKLFSLGRGTFFSFGPVRSAGEDAVTVRVDLRFGYSRQDLSRLSPGTTFYLCGAPVGAVHAVRVPVGAREIELEVLESVSVDWTLVRSPARGRCPEGWTVVSAVPVADSHATESVTLVF